MCLERPARKMGDTFKPGMMGGTGESQVDMPGPGPSKPDVAKPAGGSADVSQMGWTLVTGLLLTSMVVFPILAFFVAEWNETNVEAMRANEALLGGLQCGTYNAGTGVYTLERGGVAYAKDARDDVQFLTGFESGCVTCPAVAGAAYGAATPSECTNIMDGGTDLATRRAKDIGCSAEAAFDATLEVDQAIVNRVAVLDRAVHASTNPWSYRTGRCSGTVWWETDHAFSISSQLTDLRNALSRARNLYFVANPAPDGSPAVGLCYCQQCNGDTNVGPNSNPAGATMPCGSMFVYSGDSSKASLEMCNYAPIGGWGASILA